MIYEVAIIVFAYYFTVSTQSLSPLKLEFERTINLVNMYSNQKNSSTSVGFFLIWTSWGNRARQNDQLGSAEWTGCDQKSLICHQHLSDRFCRMHKYKKNVTDTHVDMYLCTNYTLYLGKFTCFRFLKRIEITLWT